MGPTIRQQIVALLEGHLANQKHLDLSVRHGEGTNTVAKKGGDGMGYSGYKHQRGVSVGPKTCNQFAAKKAG